MLANNILLGAIAGVTIFIGLLITQAIRSTSC